MSNAKGTKAAPIPRDRAGKDTVIIPTLRQDSLPASLRPALESEKKTQTPKSTAPSTSLYIPCPPPKRENPQPAPPARWALPRRRHLASGTRRARGASAPGSREEAGELRR